MFLTRLASVSIQGVREKLAFHTGISLGQGHVQAQQPTAARLYSFQLTEHRETSRTKAPGVGVEAGLIL